MNEFKRFNLKTTCWINHLIVQWIKSWWILSNVPRKYERMIPWSVVEISLRKIVKEKLDLCKWKRISSNWIPEVHFNWPIPIGWMKIIGRAAPTDFEFKGFLPFDRRCAKSFSLLRWCELQNSCIRCVLKSFSGPTTIGFWALSGVLSFHFISKLHDATSQMLSLNILTFLCVVVRRSSDKVSTLSLGADKGVLINLHNFVRIIRRIIYHKIIFKLRRNFHRAWLSMAVDKSMVELNEISSSYVNFVIVAFFLIIKRHKKISQHTVARDAYKWREKDEMRYNLMANKHLFSCLRKVSSSVSVSRLSEHFHWIIFRLKQKSFVR